MRCSFTLLDPNLLSCDKSTDLGLCSQAACVAPCIGMQTRGTAQQLSSEHESNTAVAWQRDI